MDTQAQPEARVVHTSDAFYYPPPVACFADQNRAAHGNVCFEDTDSSGRTRLRLVNGGHEEVGPWR